MTQHFVDHLIHKLICFHLGSGDTVPILSYILAITHITAPGASL